MQVLKIIFMALAFISLHTYAKDDRNLAVSQANSAGNFQRIALVIGNSRYIGNPVANPANDAHDMAAALREMGFNVTEKIDVTQKEMNQAIVRFGEKLNAKTIALFYYAGHGMQVKGKNYLIPVDAEITAETSIRAETVDVDTVLDQLNRSPLSIVILDACRNNPFERRFRTSGEGLAVMDAPKGTLIAYATSPGSVASDGTGRNGLYTQELLKAMRIPGLQVESMFKEVRRNVTNASGDTQTPWEMSSLTGEFYFKPLSQVSSLESIPAPVGGNVSLDDIKIQQEAREKWDKWQQNMKADFDKIATLNAKPDLQKAAWERFLSNYAQDNPYSAEDNQLRAQAQSIKQEAETQQQQVDALLEQQKNESEHQRQQAEIEHHRQQKISIGAVFRPGQTFRDCPDCPEMVVIPSGDFYIGDKMIDWANPMHRVYFGRPFAMGKTEVTQGQWRALMGNNPSYFKNCGDNCPVENVSWNDAQEYIQLLNAKTGKQYRLPSESEWEYSCRAGKHQDYCGGDNLDSVAWNRFYASPEDNRGKTTHPVATKQSNSWNIYDMSGNVWEWVEDSWHDKYNGGPSNGSAWKGNGVKRVIRGGSVLNDQQYLRAAVRFGVEPANIQYDIGFRLARSLP